MRILFVCLGNICRSPMAGALMEARTADAGSPLEVRTAGLVAQTGLGLSEHSVSAMAELDIDITSDLPAQLDRRLMDWADVVVPMERRQGREIAASFPKLAHKIHDFGEDIEDPYGSDLPAYRHCRDRIAAGVRELIPRLTRDR
jgi:protein-tyrosine-phosphatase